MSEKSGIQKAIDKVGLAALAKAVGESRQTVCNWGRRRVVPANRCIPVERASGVDRRRLRPDDWQDYWPELESQDAGASADPAARQGSAQ